uniref:M16 family metallopeptidase n=1 Tax=Reinekea sp. TaxID=1970455 RepID=UPI002A7F863E
MYKQALALGLLVSSLAGCALLSSHSGPSINMDRYQPHTSWQPTPDPLVQQGVLDNGLRWAVKVLPDNNNRDRVELRLRIRAGSLDEQESERGLAHMVEHLAFNGTARFPKHEMVAFFESAGMSFGGDINAYPSFDETVYQLTVPADRPDLIATAFEVLYDWSSAISFEVDEVASEAPVIVEEWRLSEGTEQSAGLQFFNHLYTDTAYPERMPIGDMDIVRAATAEQLRAFYQRHYRPDTIDVVVVYPQGSVDAVAAIESTFADWQVETSLADSEASDPDAVDLAGIEFLDVSDSDQLSSFWLLYLPTLSYDGDSAAGNELGFIEDLYTRALSGRLQRLGEQDNAALIDSGAAIDSLEDGQGPLQVYGTVYDGRGNEALEAMAVELKRMKKLGISAAEYQQITGQMRTEIDNWLSSLEGASVADHSDWLMSDVSGEWLPEDPQAELANLEQLVAIPLAVVNRVIGKAIEPDHLRAYFFHPMDSEFDAETAQAAYLAGWQKKLVARGSVASVVQEDAYRFPGAIASTDDRLDSEGLILWTLENELSVVFKPTDLEPGRAYVQTVLLGGNRAVADELVMASESWVEARSRSGLAGLSGQDFDDALQNLGIGYRLFYNYLYAGVDVNGPADQIDRMLQLTAGSLTETDLNETLFQLVKNSSIEEAEQFDKTPDRNFSGQYLAAVYGSDPRFSNWSGSQLATVTLADVQAVQQNLLQSHQGGLVVIVGDLDIATVEKLLTVYLAGLPLLAPSEPKTLGPITKAPQTLVISGQVEDRTDIRYVFSATEPVLSSLSLGLSKVLDEALNKRLLESIREDSGLAYGTLVFQNVKYFNESQWRLHIRFSTDPQRQDEALALLDAELARVIEVPFSAAEVAEATAKYREQMQQNLSTNGGAVSALTDTLLYGIP